MTPLDRRAEIIAIDADCQAIFRLETPSLQDPYSLPPKGDTSITWVVVS
jgi:hypothetical protein